MRRRQANVVGGRSVTVKARVSEVDYAELTRLAVAAQVTVPRLLVEAALAGGGGTATERRETLTELFKLVRLMGAISNNANQLAKKANATGDVAGIAGELRGVIDATNRLYSRVEELMEGLSLSR